MKFLSESTFLFLWCFLLRYKIFPYYSRKEIYYDVTKSEIDSAKILMHCHVASLRNKPEYVFTCFWIRQLENIAVRRISCSQMYFIIPARKIFVRYRVLKLMLMVLKYRDLNDVWVYVVSANKMEKYSEEKKNTIPGSYWFFFR